MNKPIIAKINDKFETLLLIIQAGALIIINMEHLTSKWILLTSVSILILTIALLISRQIKGLHDDIEEENLSSLQKLSDKLSGMVGKKKDSQKDDNS